VAKLPKPVTLRTILSHSTGYNFSGNAEIEQGKSRADILAKLRQRKDRRHPLSFFRYSNVLYSLVQDVITASGSSFASVFHALAQDLGAEGEITLAAPKDLTRVAYPHTPMREGRPKLQPLPQYYPKVVPAAGGAYASLNGMVKFVKLALGLCPQVMPTGLVQQSYQDVIATNDTGKFRISWPAPDAEIEHAYGLGWRIARLKQLPDQALIYHGGYLKGITPVIAIIPSLNMGIVILVNDESRFSLNMAVQFWRAALVDSGAVAA
jgi:beta-lactamase class C